MVKKNTVDTGDSTGTWDEFIAEHELAFGTAMAMRVLFGRKDWDAKVDQLRPWILEHNGGDAFSSHALRRFMESPEIPKYEGGSNTMKVVVFMGAYTEVCMKDLTDNMKAVAKSS